MAINNEVFNGVIARIEKATTEGMIKAKAEDIELGLRTGEAATGITKSQNRIRSPLGLLNTTYFFVASSPINQVHRSMRPSYRPCLWNFSP